MKRSKIYMANGLWQNAIDDTNEVRALLTARASSYQLHHHH